MPSFDGMGPNGEGPKTGRCMGNCGQCGQNVFVPKNTKPEKKLDGEGPEGKGPKTGRGLGNCNTEENA